MNRVNVRIPPRRAARVWGAALAAAMTALAGHAGATELRLLPAPSPAPRYVVQPAAAGEAGYRLVDLEHSYPWDADAAGGPSLGSGALEDLPATPDASPPEPAPRRRCVLVQCLPASDEPAAPPQKLFTTPVTLWTASALFIGVVNGAQGPIQYGVQAFHFTDEGFFQSWTYAGGADKASHFTVSANVSGLLYDAYRLNGLSPDQSFWLSVGATVTSGIIVEIGDAITPYGFSLQDLAADTLGTLAGALVKRNHLDDLISFSIGKVPTTIPPRYIGVEGESLGADYSNEMYTANLKFEGLATRLHAKPGFERFFLFSFAFFTKGFGYAPPIPSRYQEVGFEVGLNFQEILKAVGVDRSTWWGDTLLRAFSFVRIPFTQVGVYYNLKNQKWYGPGAPYHYY